MWVLNYLLSSLAAAPTVYGDAPYLVVFLNFYSFLAILHNSFSSDFLAIHCFSGSWCRFEAAHLAATKWHRRGWSKVSVTQGPKWSKSCIKWREYTSKNGNPLKAEKNKPTPQFLVLWGPLQFPKKSSNGASKKSNENESFPPKKFPEDIIYLCRICYRGAIF